MPCAAANSGAAMSRTPTNAAERADFMFTSEIHKSATAYEPDLTAFSRLILSRSTLRAGRLFFESSSRSTLLLEHDLFRKPVSTFRDHALADLLVILLVDVLTDEPHHVARPTDPGQSPFQDDLRHPRTRLHLYLQHARLQRQR